MTVTAKPYHEVMQQLADDYFAETGDWRATAADVAAWAIQNGLWEPPQQVAVKLCARDLSRAMREEYIKDGYGRPVRAKHAARLTVGPTQKTFWADIRNAPREHMSLAFQQRRKQIVGDCRQLKRDVDFYNQHHADQKPIQMLFNFEEDLEEHEAVELAHAIPREPGKPR